MKKNIRPKSPKRAKAIGMNHIALEVGDIAAALDFYGRLFELKLHAKQSSERALIDLGDQFIVLRKGSPRRPDGRRHFGLVVDDADAVKLQLDRVGKEVRRIGDYDFLDPWGNRIQIVEYGDHLSPDHT